MSTPENEKPTEATPPAASVPEAAAPAAEPASAAAPPVAEPASAAASQSPADAPAEGEGGDDGEEGDEGESEGGEGAGPEAAAQAGDAPRKKRRRRRKKKKPEGALAADGTPVEPRAPGEEGAEAAPQPQRQNRPKKPPADRDRERERPPFGVGDIVFGKVLEVTDDVMFIDLSGKAKGLFDLRELLIPEEEAKAAREQARVDAAAEAEEAKADGANVEAPPGEAPAEAASAEAAPAEALVEAAPPAEAAEPAAATETAEAAPTTEEAPQTEVTPAAAAPAEEAPQPMLPRVILEPGAQFVGVVHNDGGRGGLVVVTHHPERVSKTKPMVAQAAKDGSLVFGIITGVIKGGVEVDVDGLRAFAPASHMDVRLGADLSPLVGKRLPFAVSQYGKRGRDVVLSRRAMLEAEAKEHREAALKNIEVGADVDGVVRTVVTFGAFIDIGGIEGLVPLSEMSHNRSDGPSDVFKVGETVKVKILRVDDRGKLWLSRRATLQDPWAAVAEKYAVGTRHTGKVVRLHPAGAFVELESGVDGLVRKGDLSVKRIEHPSEVVKEGESIDVVVSSIDSRGKRIALHRAPEGDQANEPPQKVMLNKSVKVVVVLAEAAGVVVRILGVTGWQSRGYITGGGTGTARGTELRKIFPTGKELDAKVIDIDAKRGEVKLSIKALNEDTERNAYQQYRQQVKREAKFGTFADLLAKRNSGQ